eukprot:403333821
MEEISWIRFTDTFGVIEPRKFASDKVLKALRVKLYLAPIKIWTKKQILSEKSVARKLRTFQKSFSQNLDSCPGTLFHKMFLCKGISFLRNWHRQRTMNQETDELNSTRILESLYYIYRRKSR